MSLRSAVIFGSLLAHGGLVFALGEIRPPKAHVATAIEVTETVKEKLPPPPPVKVDTPPKQNEPRQRSQPKPAQAPPPEAAPPPQSNALADLPDFGLELSGGGVPGGGGLAVARPAGAGAPRSTAPVAKNLRESVAPKSADPCDEKPAKPKLLNLPQPAYTDSARAQGIEGKVRVQITVDESGKVVEVRALTSLGYGLDEAALSAARGASFQPAVRCGSPSRSTFTIAIRFSAS